MSHLPRLVGQLWDETVRFLLAGALVTVSGTALLIALLHVMPYPLAYTIVFVLSVLSNVQLHSRFVFKTTLTPTKRLKAIAAQIILFCLGLGGLAFFVQIIQIGPVLSPIANMFLCTPVNFLLMRYIFQSKAKNDLSDNF